MIIIFLQTTDNSQYHAKLRFFFKLVNISVIFRKKISIFAKKEYYPILARNTNNLMIDNTIHSAVEALRQGKTLLYPTDTIWGIGCDATNADAIEQIYALKQRDHAKSMLILCTREMLSQYVDNPSAEAVGLAIESERPTTVIFPKAINLPLNLLAQDGSIGIRVPKMAFCQQLLQELGHPIVSTSANLSGEPSPACFGDISQALKSRVGHIVADRPEYNRESPSSRIVKLSATGEIIVLRE